MTNSNSINNGEIETIPPRPTDQMIYFLAWLKKLNKGAGVNCKRCDKKWGGIGYDYAQAIKRLGRWDKVAIYRIPGGDKVVFLSDTGWADGWTRRYDREIPHHGQWHRLGNSFFR